MLSPIEEWGAHALLAQVGREGGREGGRKEGRKRWDEITSQRKKSRYSFIPPSLPPSLL